MADAASRRGRRIAGRMRASAHRARPSLKEAALGGLAWALVMAASAAFETWRIGWSASAGIGSVATIFGVGAALAFAPALFCYRLAARRQPPETRFAAALLAFGLGTAGLTAAVYALYHRDYFADWHESAFTVTWFFQFAFTVAGAIYQFAVLGLRLYVPLGLLALFALAAWLASRR